jgi:phosphatidylglycerophosphate synthase
MPKYSYSYIRNNSRSKYSCWVHVLLYYPISLPIVWVISNFTNRTPNQVTIFQFILRLVTIYPFYVGTPEVLPIAGLMFLFSSVMDVADGRLARLKDQKSYLGAHMDPMLDLVGDFLCIAALTYSQVFLYHDLSLLAYGMVFAFLNIFISTETMHLKLVRQGWSSQHETSQVHKNTHGNSDNYDRGPYTLFKYTIDKMKNFQKKYRFYFFSIDVLDIRFIALIIGPITGYVKECMIIGVVLLLFKFFLAKLLQIIKKEPVYFS